MKVTIELPLGWDVDGRRCVDLELNRNTISVSDALAQLLENCPALCSLIPKRECKDLSDYVLLVCKGAVMKPSSILRDGDTLKLLLPLDGGQRN